MFFRSLKGGVPNCLSKRSRLLSVEASQLNDKHIPNPAALKWVQQIAKTTGAKKVHIAEGSPLDMEALERDVFDRKIEVGFAAFADASRRTLAFMNGVWQINDKKFTNAELESMLERSLTDGTLYVVPYALGKGASVKITDSPLIVLSATRFDKMGQSAWEVMGSRDSFERLLHNSKFQIFPEEPESTKEKVKMSYNIHSGNVGAPNPLVDSPFSTAPRRRNKDE
jgi:GTP-dependent phosphoenolpyruvate carboxykinase